MTGKVYNVLFLCTGNSARSIIAESLLNALGKGRFRAWSAGSEPKGAVHPQAFELLARLGYPTLDLRSKGWDEFAGADAPAMDVVITVCDNAANEVCPVWPGHPVTAHWSLPDPAAASAREAEHAFAETHRVLTDRICEFVDLPIGSLDATTLKRRIDAMSR
jgi:protein-tyrosine-phosphatase